MIKLSVRNHRGCSKADVELEKIALLAGENGHGKTSFLDAVRSVATGKPTPYKDVTKKIGSMLVRSGTASGHATLKIDDYNHSRVDWPECKYTSTGSFAVLSDIAAGIESLATMKVADRINYMLSLTKKETTKKAFIKELADKEIFSSDIEIDKDLSFIGLWEKIDINGWDVVWEDVKSRGAVLKGKWEQVTGEKWGKLKSKSWLPEHWDQNLNDVNISTLEEDLKSCKEWLEAAIKDEAITESEIEKLKILAGNIGSYKTKMYDLQTEYNQQDSLKTKLKVERRELDNNKGDILKCPSCKTEVLLKNGKLIKFSSEELRKIMSNINTITSEIVIVENTVNRLFDDYSAAKVDFNSAVQAQEKLNKIKSQVSNDESDEKSDEKIEEMRQKLTIAELRLTSKTQITKANQINDTIQKNISLAEILSPGGIRLSLLKQGLDLFNNSMLRLTDSVGWKPIEISENCIITCNGIPYGRFLAKSELYRTEILLQLMCSMHEKAEFVVIDNADELTESIRNDLFYVLIQSGIKCIVATALDKKELLKKDLLKEGGINAYWVKEGRVV